MTKKRLKTLLYNAIAWIDKECNDFFVSSVDNEYEWYENTLGITKKELQEVGIDWINEASTEIDHETEN